jgi:hypothetical protein
MTFEGRQVVLLWVPVGVSATSRITSPSSCCPPNLFNEHPKSTSIREEVILDAILLQRRG